MPQEGTAPQIPELNQLQRLEKLFTPQKIDASQASHMDTLRHEGLQFAKAILLLCPPGADRSAAIRHIREALFTANASIAQEGLNL